MNVNLRVIILTSFVGLLLGLMIFRSCSRPPQKGEQVYKKNCASCHGADGEGFRNIIPPLNDSLYLANHRNDFACIVGYGLKGEIIINGKTFDQPMAGIEALNTTEIANVANYVYERWSSLPKKFSPKDIERALVNCK